jgi:hypothetical protein
MSVARQKTHRRNQYRVETRRAARGKFVDCNANPPRPTNLPPLS